jgi:hypothetical protein
VHSPTQWVRPYHERYGQVTTRQQSQAIEVGITLVGPDGQPKYELIEVDPGSRAADIRRGLNLPADWGFRLAGRGEPFAETDDIYQALKGEENPKLQAIPNMTVGSSEVGASAPTQSFWDRVTAWVAGSTPTAPQPVVRVTARRVSPRLRPHVAFVPPSLWQDQGWREVRSGFWEGTYVTPYAVYAGFIARDGFGFYKPGMYTKPAEVEAHPHKECFMSDREFGDYHVLHHKTKPTSVDAALVSITEYLTVAYKRAHGR